MGAENTPIRWLRSRPTSGGYAADKIDTEQGILHDVVMVQEGPAKGHGVHLEAEFISDLVAYDQRTFGDRGVKARFGHPGASSETMGTQMGTFKNIRKRKNADGQMQAIGDLHLLEAAEESPTHPGMRSWMLKMAAQQPDFVMSSIVFRAAGYYQRKPNGHKHPVQHDFEDGWINYKEEYGNIFVDFGEKGQHFYTDMVEAGAATDNLFSNQANPHLFVAQAGEFLEEHPDLKQFIQQNPGKVREFLAATGINLAPMPEEKKPTLLRRFIDSFSEKEEEQFTEELSTLQTEKESLETATTDLQTQVTDLSTSLTEAASENAGLNARIKELETALATAQTRITALEKEPAAPISNGPTEPAEKANSGTSAWNRFKAKHSIV